MSSKFVGYSWGDFLASRFRRGISVFLALSNVPLERVFLTVLIILQKHEVGKTVSFSGFQHTPLYIVFVGYSWDLDILTDFVGYSWASEMNFEEPDRLLFFTKK